MPRRLSTLLVALVSTASLTGCSLLGGDTDDAGGNEAVEQSSLQVAVLPSVEAAPLHMAVKDGFFAAEGIEKVEVTTLSSGQAAISGLIGGDYDVVYTSYVPAILAQAEGVADLRFVTGNSGAAPETAVLMTAKDSEVKQVEDLANKRIAVPAINTSADLMVKSVLDAHDIDVDAINWAQMSFADMPTALKDGNVDAAMVVEPFITLSAVQHGATPVVDLSQGPAARIPFTAYASTAEWVDKNPKTVAAWQRTMARVTEAVQDREVIERAITNFAGVDEDTTKLMHIPAFQSSLDETNVQRVADMMTQFGVLSAKFDVAPMLVPPPAPAES